jgi:hypothetical protein
MADALESRRWRPYVEEHSNNENGPTALLRDLTLWLEGDAMDLYFSWQALQNQCARVWHKLERSLSADPGWDKDWSKDPSMGIYIITSAAANEEVWGYIAKDDPKFATSLRKAHEAIQSTIFETQEEPKTALGILGVDPRSADCITWGGDVCVARLAKENKYFATTISGSAGYTLADLYRNWLPSLAIQTHAFKRVIIAAEALEEEHRKNVLNIMRFYENIHNRAEDGAPDDDDAFDPCADCARCKRRKYLGHRYPNYGNVEEGFDRGLYDLGEFETFTDDEDEG